MERSDRAVSFMMAENLPAPVGGRLIGEPRSGLLYGRLHWNATFLLPSGLVVILEMTCGDPAFMQ